MLVPSLSRSPSLSLGVLLGALLSSGPILHPAPAAAQQAGGLTTEGSTALTPSSGGALDFGLVRAGDPVSQARAGYTPRHEP